MTTKSSRPVHSRDALSGPVARARCAALLEQAAADTAKVSDPAVRAGLRICLAAELASLHGVDGGKGGRAPIPTPIEEESPRVRVRAPVPTPLRRRR